MVNKVHNSFNVKVLKKTLNKAMREFEGKRLLQKGTVKNYPAMNYPA